MNKRKMTQNVVLSIKSIQFSKRLGGTHYVQELGKQTFLFTWFLCNCLFHNDHAFILPKLKYFIKNSIPKASMNEPGNQRHYTF